MTMTKRAGLFRFQLPVLNPDADIYETLNMSQFSPNIKIVIYLTCCQCLVVHWFCMNVNQKKQQQTCMQRTNLDVSVVCRTVNC